MALCWTINLLFAAVMGAFGNPLWFDWKFSDFIWRLSRRNFENLLLQTTKWNCFVLKIAQKPKNSIRLLKISSKTPFKINSFLISTLDSINFPQEHHHRQHLWLIFMYLPKKTKQKPKLMKDRKRQVILQNWNKIILFMYIYAMSAN